MKTWTELISAIGDTYESRLIASTQQSNLYMCSTNGGMPFMGMDTGYVPMNVDYTRDPVFEVPVPRYIYEICGYCGNRFHDTGKGACASCGGPGSDVILKEL